MSQRGGYPRHLLILGRRAPWSCLRTRPLRSVTSVRSNKSGRSSSASRIWCSTSISGRARTQMVRFLSRASRQSTIFTIDQKPVARNQHRTTTTASNGRAKTVDNESADYSSAMSKTGMTDPETGDKKPKPGETERPNREASGAEMVDLARSRPARCRACEAQGSHGRVRPQIPQSPSSASIAPRLTQPHEKDGQNTDFICPAHFVTGHRFAHDAGLPS